MPPHCSDCGVRIGSRIAKRCRACGIIHRYADVTDEKRFYAKTKRVDSGCVEWQGGIRNVYGGFRFKGKTESAHHVAWWLAGRTIPEGHYLLHTCDNYLCVNVDHLFTGTQQDNMDDCVRKNRNAAGEKNGHSKLTAIQVAEIRALRGVRSGRELSRIYCVSPQLICNVQRGRCWKEK